MRSQVTKWGNSLAVRIPAKYAREVGLREGDTVELKTTAAGEITLSVERPFDKNGFLQRLARLRNTISRQRQSAGDFVRAMREDERY